MPADIIKELDENIQKYQSDGTISDSDIIRLGTRISNNELHNIEELNGLAKKDSQKFVDPFSDVDRRIFYREMSL